MQVALRQPGEESPHPVEEDNYILGVYPDNSLIRAQVAGGTCALWVGDYS